MDDATVDFIHSLRQILSAAEEMTRTHLEGASPSGNPWAQAVRRQADWSSVYESIEHARIRPAFDKASALGLIEDLVRELDFLQNELDNLAADKSKQQETDVSSDVDLVPIIRDVVELFEAKAARKYIDIQLIVTGALIARIATRAFRRAIINLFDNAVKYSFQGATGRLRRIECKVWRHSTAGEIRISIGSFGVGVDPDERDRVFERGYRSRRALDEHRSGTGIGLSEARRIVGQAGGRIELDSSEQHEGAFLTTVTITLQGAGHA